MTEPCDFCDAVTEDLVEFAVDPEDIPIVLTTLSGGVLEVTIPAPGTWRACSVCEALIEASDRDGLLWRSQELVLGHIGMLMRIPPARRRQLLAEHRRGLAALHARFWRGVTDADDYDDDDLDDDEAA